MTENRFRLDSGERQVGEKLDDIRADHINRYECVIDHLKMNFTGNRPLKGLDIFSATGYGSFLVASEIPCRIDAVDGSAEAIEFAKKHFFHERISYSARLFPFPVAQNNYDFVICIESLEHVPEYEQMISVMDKALKPGGLLFLSVPNEDVLSLEKSKNEFHVKHFTKDELVDKYYSKLNYELLAHYGQDAYVLNDGYIAGYIEKEKMRLKKDYSGQWLMLVMKKN